MQRARPFAVERRQSECPHSWHGRAPICGIQFLVPPKLLLDPSDSAVGDLYHECTVNLPSILDLRPVPAISDKPLRYLKLADAHP